jgi:hypothetical protein
VEAVAAALCVTVIAVILTGYAFVWFTPSLYVTWPGGGPLRWVKCRRCGGLGVMWLHDGRLDIIPPHLRDVHHSKFAPVLANFVECPNCNGFGRLAARQRPVHSGEEKKQE